METMTNTLTFTLTWTGADQEFWAEEQGDTTWPFLAHNITSCAWHIVCGENFDSVVLIVFVQFPVWWLSILYVGGTVFLWLKFLWAQVVNGTIFLVNSSTSYISQSWGTFVQITKPASPMIEMDPLVRDLSVDLK